MNDHLDPQFLTNMDHSFQEKGEMLPEPFIADNLINWDAFLSGFPGSNWFPRNSHQDIGLQTGQPTGCLVSKQVPCLNLSNILYATAGYF